MMLNANVKANGPAQVLDVSDDQAGSHVQDAGN